MSIANNIIAVLSFNDTSSGASKLLRKIYFSLAYNTTFPVNLMLTLGAISPLILFQAVQHDLTMAEFLSAVSVTFLATYCYNLIYIVNDYIDHDKDMLLSTPKQSALQVLGENYLQIVLGTFVVVIGVASLLVPGLLVPLICYSLALAGLSVLHSNFQNIKLVSIFIERFAKFCAPLWLVLIITGNDDVGLMLAGALIVYPLSYTQDYAYRGYIRDRLKLAQSLRFLVYAVYFALVIGLLNIDAVQERAPLTLNAFAAFIGIYAAGCLIAEAVARFYPFRFLDANYNSHVAWEKRRLLAFGLVQAAILACGAVYAIFS